MNLQEIETWIRKVDAGGISELEAVAEAFRAAGYKANEGVGTPCETAEDKLRWYVGQGISMAEERAYFAVNSWVNYFDVLKDSYV